MMSEATATSLRPLGPSNSEITASTVGSQAAVTVGSALRSRSRTGSRSGSRTGASAGSWHVIRSPVEALAQEERLRIRNYAIFSTMLLVGAVGALPLLDGDPTAKWIHLVGNLISLAGAIHTAYHSWSPSETPKPWLSNALGFLTIPSLTTGYLYWGDMSPVAAVVPLGVIIFGLSQSFRGAIGVYLLCAIPLGALSGLIAAGVTPDRGLVNLADMSAMERLMVASLAQFIFIASFVLTRQMRRVSLQTMEQLTSATRDAAARQALLDEAQERLRAIAKVGGPGRFTDQTLGPYKLGVIIGRGAMGEVYEGRNKESGEQVAVKVLSQLATTPANVRRFVRETEVSKSLASPNVVSVRGVSEPADLMPYLAMELLQGDTLRDHLRKAGGLSFDETLDLVKQVAAGLRAAHEAGIVHRDLKPANIFRHAPNGQKPVWKVLDFGVSKLVDSTGTMTGNHVVGTPAYMPPEQARGKDVGPSADHYALAAIAYRCLCGRAPFLGQDAATVLYDVVHTMPPRPSDQPGVPADVDNALAIGLAKHHRDRFSSLDELVVALSDAFGSGVSDSVQRRGERLQHQHPWNATRRSDHAEQAS